jgi:uncharacterized protein YceK
MAARATCVALLFATLPAAGCGTVANLARPNPEAGGRVPFGGVRQDVACLRRAADGEAGGRPHPKPESEHYPQLALALFCAADLPFSLVGDVVTWPYVVAYSCANRPVPVPPLMLADTPPPPPPTLPAPRRMPPPVPPPTLPPAEGLPEGPPKALPEPAELP